jgi:3-hydroxyacyl-CoA dehydrogenase
MTYKIDRVVVIGGGTMGAAIAAHLANAGVSVNLLDIVPSKLTPEQEAKGLTLQDKVVRNSIVDWGLEQAIKSRPASFMSKDRANLIKGGNLEDNFDVIQGADWIIEVIIENLKIKQQLMARIDEVRSAHTIVSTNTSGIPIASITEGRSQGLRQHFLGTHYFNPPRYLKLLEIIPGPDTLPEVLDVITHFNEYRLGKGIVMCKDTPNFIGNRILSGGGAFTMDYVITHGYTVDEVDTLTGPLIGRPKTATFRLLDLVGIDVMDHVNSYLTPAIAHDKAILPYLNSEAVNNLLHAMIEKKWLGNKTKVGFYKAVEKESQKEFWSLNLKTLEHEPPVKVRFDSVGKAKDVENLGERLKIILAAEDRAGELVRAITYQGLFYASSVIPEIADTPMPIDDALRWGFAHEAGPFEQWDMLGVAETADKMRQAGFAPAPWVDEMLKANHTTFYQYQGDRKVGVYNAVKCAYEANKRSPAIIVLKEEKDTGKIIRHNDGASLVDLGDGVACVEFHTKMNAIDDDIIGMLKEALDKAETDFEGLVVGNDAPNFSAGANLFMIVMAAKQGMWDMLEDVVHRFQGVNMRMRYFPKPVVIAPAGLALGGGSEIIMHGNRVVAAAELYAGLVEVGVGVIPAGGGTKEMVRRIITPAMRTPDAIALPFLQRAFMQVGMAKVATSADEARELGILGEADRVVLNRDFLMAEAKREVLHMAGMGYRPLMPEKLFAAGRDSLASLRAGINMFKEAKQITPYDAVVAEKLAYVLTGGELSSPAWVAEQYILDLECEAFLSLCGEERTQERMAHTLQTGKPLRN